MRVAAVLEIVVLGALVLVASCGLSVFLWGSPVPTPAIMVVFVGIALFTCRFQTRRAIRTWARTRSLELLSIRAVCCDYKPHACPDVTEFTVHVADQAGTKRSVRLQVSSYLFGLVGYSVRERKASEVSSSNTE